jgi:heme/copper-type cytochrome/quinol oxidase subunit 2
MIWLSLALYVLGIAPSFAWIFGGTKNRDHRSLSISGSIFFAALWPIITPILLFIAFYTPINTVKMWSFKLQLWSVFRKRTRA